MAIHPKRPTGVRATSALACAATLLTLAIAPAAARAQTAGAKPQAENLGKIGVATIGPAGLPADLRIRLEDAAAAGLRASGAEVVSATELSKARAAASLGACADAVCEQRLAQITEARYWLRGTCALDSSTYRIHLELTDARTGAVVSARDDTCDICTEAEAAESVNIAASALKATLTRKLGVPAASPPPAPEGNIAGDSAGTSASTPSTGAGADMATGERPTWLRVLPWVAFVGAAAAIAGGAYELSRGGKDDGCHAGPNGGQVCTRSTDTTAEAMTLFGVGAALAATGIVLLVMPPPSSGAPAVASSPPSLALGWTGRALTLSGSF